MRFKASKIEQGKAKNTHPIPSFIPSFLKKVEEKFGSFTFLLLYLPPRTCQRWLFGVADGSFQDILRKRVRLFPSGESGQFAILGKWMHEWLVRTEKDDTRSTSIVWCTMVSYRNAILRRCELLFNQFFPHRSVQNLPLEKRQKAHTFLLCLILWTTYY